MEITLEQAKLAFEEINREKKRLDAQSHITKDFSHRNRIYPLWIEYKRIYNSLKRKHKLGVKI